ncbi:hypothetical protein GQ55_2G231200 [Panicum hallii var. hallii]|uniref:Uncharacterized protein n=1 Tax=Panicum hallii var. hallii TaxID=1504633 RepID=A0A2T7ERI8_9POAL|nr:hypothetical protein GQ55_2G231200 [Panicum hallii var. hallii]
MLRLRNRLLPLVRAASQLPSPIHRSDCFRLLSNSPAPFSLEDYLVASCGLAPAQARSASKKALAEASRLSAKAFNDLTSARHHTRFDPDAVVALLSSIGLPRADIADVVAADPLFLRSRVDRLGPRLRDLRDSVGLSVPQIARFLAVGSRLMRGCSDLGPKIQFYVNFFGSFEKLLSFMKGNNSLLTADLDKVIKPNIALLRQRGLSVRDIAQLCSRNARLLTFNPERVQEVLQRAEELGVPRSSGKFRQAVAALACTTKQRDTAMLEFLKTTLGCSKSEAAIAVSKVPVILSLSEQNLLRKFQFMINDVGLEPQYILERSILFTHSLEKRLVPRHCVMKILLAKGLLETNLSFYSIARMGEKSFRLRFIDYHKDSVTGLADAYAAACRGRVPSGDQL